ncbi:uncharacterized protein LOC132259886 isoform X2 [Phlebotomus argentipes]|uniref:uncharacterized protein LOC132259886 isoform X2 n=1 Tax=Phlebotomus argentipes TaxID=94469 RepID=UPI00289302E0|nr:uncharacterized protein LOC132259886 isoform X2 [Phlebotomus argentipes]
MAFVPKQCLTSALVRSMVFPYLRVWKSSHVDQIDCFTNELEEIKCLKNNQKVTVRHTQLEINVRNLDECQLKQLFEATIEQDNAKDFDVLLQEVINWRRSYLEDTLSDILEMIIVLENRNFFEKLRDFCEKTHPEVFTMQEVRLLWKEGNTDKALEMLRKVYEEITPNRLTEARRIIRTFSRETVGKKSEAVLVSLIKLAEEISSLSGDCFPLNTLWHDCFFSRFFSDQQIGIKLFREHCSIQNFLQQRLKIIVFKLLQKHRLETVYRLIELLLDPSVDMKASCRDVLLLLFDYQFWRHNSAGCLEIIQCSGDLGIPLGPDYDKKLVMLLMTPRKTVVPPRDKAVSSIRYKF